MPLGYRMPARLRRRAGTQSLPSSPLPSPSAHPHPHPHAHQTRYFRFSARRWRSQATGGPGDSHPREPLRTRLKHAWKNTPTTWYPLPFGLGAALLAFLSYRKNAAREPEVVVDGQVLKVQGPWQVHVIGALPLRQLSRLWGYLNSLEIPVWARPAGFRLYAWIFGCDINEIEHADLTSYPSLGVFFYRKLRPGARPIADAPVVSPADGRLLHFGTITGSKVEQVKGITYSLDALLGLGKTSLTPGAAIPFNRADKDADHELVADEEFANVNGIEYSLDRLLGADSRAQEQAEHEDAAVEQGADAEHIKHDASVAVELGPAALPYFPGAEGKQPVPGPGNKLFFAVIYLAPGDYHRFHSPVAWVAERRRHFAGDLFSVSPWMAARLPNLFVLNERVALLGRWRYGFFSMTPVGATNVGSILLNFDKELRTNTGRRPPRTGAFTEAVYANASRLLGGQPLAPGEEMGGFCLGSTIVLVYEAPEEFEFKVGAGEKVRVGQALMGAVEAGAGVEGK